MVVLGIDESEVRAKARVAQANVIGDVEKVFLEWIREKL
jgi:hypothetical protein